MIQLQVINYLLATKDKSLILLNNLTEDYFNNYRQEFLFIKNHLNKFNNIPDVETFLATFKDFDIIDVHESPSYLINELFKNYKNNLLASTFNKVKGLLLSGKTDEAMLEYNKTNDILSKTGIALKSTDIITDKSRFDAYEERTKNFSKYFVSTGLKEIDSIIGGWDREEENAVIIARTGQGKSWLALKFAEAAVAQGLKVGFYSGEMTARKVGYRFDTLSGHIANGSLVHGNSNVLNEYENYIESLPTRYKGSLKVLNPSDLGDFATVSILRAFIDREHLDILFIDQYSLLKDERNAKTPTEAAANIAIDINKLQQLVKIPIISIAQMNREKNDDGIDSSQIGVSDRIGQNATMVLGITRDKKDKTLFKITLVKSRDNEMNNVINYKVDLNRGLFEYIPSENDGVVDTQKDNYQNRYTNVNTGEVF